LSPQYSNRKSLLLIMAFNSVVSWFAEVGGLDCAMRSRQCGFGGEGKRPMPSEGSPLHSPASLPSNFASGRPPIASNPITAVPLPSNFAEDHLLAERALHLWRSSEYKGAMEPGGNGDLPDDFARKIADMVARDRQVRHMLVTGDILLSGPMNSRSRFLRDCIRDRPFCSSSTSWRGLSLQDKQEFLMAYQRGPPSPSFFLDMMMPACGSSASSECGTSSSADLETSSETNTRHDRFYLE